MTDETLQARLDRLESRVKRQQQTIEEQRDQIARLERKHPETRQLVVADGGDIKVLGEMVAEGGTGVLGKVVGDDGYGVKGESDGDGYGLYTPDAARVDDILEVGTLGGDLTGDQELTNMAGSGLSIENGALSVVGVDSSSEPNGQAPTNLNVVLDGMEGTGEDYDPYIVTTDHELQAMSADYDAHFELGNSIDASLTHQWNDGDGFEPVAGGSFDRFEGSLDGNGYSIDDLTVADTGDAGLFAEVRDGTVSNLVLKNSTVDIDTSSTSGALAGRATSATIRNVVARNVTVVGGNRSRRGGLVGDAGATTVENCVTSGHVEGDGFIGGLVGLMSSSTGAIEQSYSTCEVTGSGTRVGGLVGSIEWGATVEECFATGTVTGTDAVGGLAGRTRDDGAILRSYAIGAVEGDDQVGGLVGLHSDDDGDSSLVSESFATGSVTGSGSNVGGLIGENEGSDAPFSYWDTQSTGQPDSDGGNGRTTDEMTGDDATQNMDGLDFAQDWDTVTDPDDYPVLVVHDTMEQLLHRS